ncbi:MAG TPA: prenyltransferase/squalene oxidase repeat-containing protein [Candidatus Lokiarchaeia archaeon]|nr:prenyltransferase/squalene oxidase repeat-containing protein [Candidatus Lokiarchaeia archaeon]
MLGIQNPALSYFVRRDLLDEIPGSIESIWRLPAAQKLLKKQLPSGAWPDPQHSKHAGVPTNYELVETYSNLNVLAAMFGVTTAHPAIHAAVEFLFSCQHPDGDFRGIYGSQYSTNYTGGILEVIVKNGCTDDDRVDRAFLWLLDHQQANGGWTIPMQTHGIKSIESTPVLAGRLVYPFQPEKEFAHMVTGIVLRAFAAYPKYRAHPDAVKAARLITTRFFRKDAYSSRQAPSYWTKYTFPYWWTDLISVLDALSLMGLSKDMPGINKALAYFHDDQQPEGTWIFSLSKNKSLPDLNGWLTFMLCRIIKRFYAN